MNRTVYLHNWALCIEPAIEELELAAAQAARGSPEQSTMFCELDVLRTMIQQVKQVDPEDRPCLDSPLIACSVREPINVSQSLIERVGEIHDIYRRFRTRLVWPT
jgi:hypothetical protein